MLEMSEYWHMWNVRNIIQDKMLLPARSVLSSTVLTRNTRFCIVFQIVEARMLFSAFFSQWSQTLHQYFLASVSKSIWIDDCCILFFFLLALFLYWPVFWKVEMKMGIMTVSFTRFLVYFCSASSGQDVNFCFEIISWYKNNVIKKVGFFFM